MVIIASKEVVTILLSLCCLHDSSLLFRNKVASTANLKRSEKIYPQAKPKYKQMDNPTLLSTHLW